MVIWWLEIGRRIAFLGSLRLEFCLGAFLSVVAAIRINQSYPKAFQDPIIRATLLYMIVLLVSLPFSVDIAHSWDIYSNQVVKLMMVAIFMKAFIGSVYQLKLFLISTLVAFCKIGSEALIGKITGQMVWENQGVMRLHGAAGSMFGHPNSLSGKYLGVFPFVWYLYPLLEKKWKVILAILLLLMANILIFTASRTGYVAFMAALLYLTYNSKKKIKYLAIIVVFFSLSISFIPDQYVERFISSYTGIEREGHSRETRIGLLTDSLSIFLENPLGVGMGGFRLVQKKQGRNAQETHNLYTQILTETGIQGFIAFSILIITIFKRIKIEIERLRQIINENEGSIHKKESYPREPLYIGNKILSEAQFLINVCYAIKLYLFIRLVLGLFGHDLYEIYWWIVAGMIMAISTCSYNLKREANKDARNYM